MKSVLVVAGHLKRAEPEMPEEQLLMRALRDFNVPKIVQQDEVVFFGAFLGSPSFHECRCRLVE